MRQESRDEDGAGHGDGGAALPLGGGSGEQEAVLVVQDQAQTLAQPEANTHKRTLTEAQLQTLKNNRFASGKSGNPGGRPKGALAELQAKARGFGAEAIDKLAALMRTAKDQKVQRDSAIALLDRGYGKIPIAQAIPETDALPGDELTNEALDKFLDA